MKVAEGMVRESSARLMPQSKHEIMLCEERHYSVAELAAVWNLSKQTIRRLFQDEPDVVRIGEQEVRHRRMYVTLRIPETVVRRVHQRLRKSA